MSSTLTQRTKALVVGAVLAAATTLAVLPGTAEAAKKTGGDVAGNAGSSSGISAPAPIDSGATLDSASGTTQDTTISEQPQVSGATDSTTEVIAPAAPADGAATADGNVAAGDTLNEDVCLNGALNQDAGGCGDAAAAAPAPGGDADTTLDGSIDTTTSLGENADGTLGFVDAPAASLTDGGATLDSTSGTTQDAAIFGQPQLDGATNSTTEAAVPAAPVQGTFGVDETVAVGDTVNEDVCVQGGFNAPAGSCDAPAGTTPVNADVTALDGTLDAGLDTAPAAVDSASGTTQDATISEQPQLEGTTNSITEANVPALPVEATAGLDQNVAVGDTVNEDVCVQLGVNAPAGSCGAQTGGDGTLAPPALDPTQTTLDSASSVTQGATLGGQPQLEGTVNSITEANVPGAPAEATAGLDQNVAVGDTVNEDVCVQLGVNAPAGSCGAQTGGDGGNGTPTLPALTPVVADVDGTVGFDAPIVPVQSETGVEGDIAADNLADLGICLNAGVNQDPGACGNGGPGSGGSGNGNGSGGGSGNGGGGAPIVGDIDGSIGVDAPIVPVEGGIITDDTVVVDDTAELGVCLGVGVNRDPASCGQPAPGNGGPGNGGNVDPGPGNGGPGNGPDNGGPGNGPGNGGPGNGGPGNGGGSGNGGPGNGPGNGGPGNGGPGNGGGSGNVNNGGNGKNGGSDGTAPNLVVGDGALPNISGATPDADTASASVSTSDPSGESDGAGGAVTPPSGDIALVSTQPLAQQEQEAASSDASSAGEQSSAGEEKEAQEASSDGGETALAAGSSAEDGASTADSSSDEQKASGNGAAAGVSLPETGGISPLLPIAALLLMGAALVLVARRRIDS